jgi:hypothetical protein
LGEEKGREKGTGEGEKCKGRGVGEKRMGRVEGRKGEEDRERGRMGR